MLTIGNYSLGNRNSVTNMILHVGGECRIIGTPGEIASAEKLLLPCSGTFNLKMDELKEPSIADSLSAAVLERENAEVILCVE